MGVGLCGWVSERFVVRSEDISDSICLDLHCLRLTVQHQHVDGLLELLSCCEGSEIGRMENAVPALCEKESAEVTRVLSHETKH